MAQASQLHKFNTRGSDSEGNRKALQYIQTQHGTDAIPAIIVLDGLWSGTDTITVNTDIGAGNVESVYSPSGNESATAAATGLAAVINGKADHTAVGVLNTVRVTKTTAGTVNVVSSVIS